MNMSFLNLLLPVVEEQEFYRLRSSLRAKQEHASLLEDFKEFDRTRLDLEEGVGSPEQALLKEHVAINRNTGQVYEVKIVPYFNVIKTHFCSSLFYAYFFLGWDGLAP